jgi:hypothetical protein
VVVEIYSFAYLVSTHSGLLVQGTYLQHLQEPRPNRISHDPLSTIYSSASANRMNETAYAATVHAKPMMAIRHIKDLIILSVG